MNSTSPTAIVMPVDGLLDHLRGEALAARIRAALRSGATGIDLELAPGTTLASWNLPGFLLRVETGLRSRGGRLRLTGDAAALASFAALGFATDRRSDGDAA